MESKKNDLIDRLANFAVMIIRLAEGLPESYTGKYLAGQMIRSGTSPALHYGEAWDAESNQDFIHKIKIMLKELRETSNALLIINKLGMNKDQKIMETLMDENNQLISIFVSSVKTAKKNISHS